MKFFDRSLLVLILALFVAGCGGRETTVIQPTEQYELTDQEQKNRDREQEMLAEQRQE